MAIVLDGNLGITSPAETVQGALTTTGNTILGDASTDTLNVGNGGLVKDASGNVGIGTASPSGAYKLQITNGSIYTGVTSDGSNGIVESNGALFVRTNTNNPVIFGTGVGATERMRIDSSGNVGIGTSSLSGKFNVQQDQAAYSYFDYTNATNGGGVVFRQIVRNLANTGTTSVDLAKLISSGFVINNNDTGAANYTGFGVGASERMRIDSSGNLLVGTTSNTDNCKANIQFSGDATNGVTIKNLASSGDPNLFLLNDSAQTLNNTSNSASYQDSTAQRWILRKNGGLANYSANNVNLSDERTKKDIVNAGSYLDKICAIPVRTFLYKDQTDTQLNLGVIAQEVESVAPELVEVSGFGETPKDGVPLKAIYQTDLQYALMKCIQEQQALIIQLQADVAALKALSA